MSNVDTTTNGALNDFQVPDQIDDSISCLKWNPNPNTLYLASVGWDAKVRVWQANYQVGMNQTASINSSLMFSSQFNDPLLSLCWQPEGNMLYTGSCDGTLHCVDLNQGRQGSIGKHEIGCKEVIYIPGINLVLSGGWDGKLNFWDLRQQSPALSIDLGRKVYTMSMASTLLVVGTSDRAVSYFNLNKLQQPGFTYESIFESHLRYQTRKIACFPEGNGYAIGSIEGRVAIKYVDLNKAPEINQETKSMNTKDDFAFRCHRVGESMAEVYPINDVAFNPVHGTFCTAGGDGSWIIWDKDSRSRLKAGTIQNKTPVTAVDYSANGDLLAYATGYDWTKGVAFEGSCPNKVAIHYCPDADKHKKKKK